MKWHRIKRSPFVEKSRTFHNINTIKVTLTERGHIYYILKLFFYCLDIVLNGQ